jgi:hypothetical protein
MKSLHHFAALVVLAGFVFTATGMASQTSSASRGHDIVIGANVDLTLQNKCTRDVKYSVSNAGATTQGVVAKGDKVKLNLAIGAVITVDGEQFMTVSAADNGQTFQVCR